MSKCNSRGFTLIELVVTIVVLGILAAVAIPKIFSVSKEAEIASVKTMVSSLESTLSLYTVNQVIKGNEIVVHNPFDDLVNIPTNYNGTNDPVNPSNTENGKWSYRSTGNWIMYNPKSSITGGWSSGGESYIIYQVQLVVEDGNTVGIRLTTTPTYTYSWN